ncbi:response regulator transcription factor [soil metagenome]
MNATVLVVEDDDGLRELLSFHLSQAGFSVVTAPTLAAAWASVGRAAVVVLDLMLPDGSGVDWLRQYRAQMGGNALPVLMLTARASELDKVSGLEAGADDYLVKPFSTAELVARLRALLRRTHTDTKHTVGDLVVDEAEGSAVLNTSPLQLTRREFDLLVFLAAHTGRVFSRVDLLDRVWGEDFLGTERTVDQHVAQLRALIGAERIETVRGRGYRLVGE